MEICRDLEQWRPVRNAVVTVGSYDGVHRAHRSIIDLLNRHAEAEGGESVLITFSPHPRLVLHGEEAFRKNFRLLTTEQEKEELLAAAGLRNRLVLHFD
ncbi:MAG: FAD synthetase, partial [Bacteroidales bacterium]|nr:FAD synthetase [Bacteroidales bacterium]